MPTRRTDDPRCRHQRPYRGGKRGLVGPSHPNLLGSAPLSPRRGRATGSGKRSPKGVEACSSRRPVQGAGSHPSREEPPDHQSNQGSCLGREKIPISSNSSQDTYYHYPWIWVDGFSRLASTVYLKRRASPQIPALGPGCGGVSRQTGFRPPGPSEREAATRISPDGHRQQLRLAVPVATRLGQIEPHTHKFFD